MPVQGPSTPYPTPGPEDAGKGKQDVNLQSGTAAIAEVKDTAPPTKAKDDFSAEAPGPRYERPTAPPGFDSAEFDKKMQAAEGVINALGPAGEAALAEAVDQLKQNPELMADPNKFFASLEQTLQAQLEQHGVAIPPEGFDKLEQISDLVQSSSPTPVESGAHVETKAAAGKNEAPANVPGSGNKNEAPANVPGSGNKNESNANVPGSGGGGSVGDPAWAPLPTTNFAILGSMPDGDIEALAFLVLMQAAKSAQEDVRAVMASVKAINATKAKMREVLQQRQKLAGQSEVAKLTAGQGGKDGADGGAFGDPTKGGGALTGYKVSTDPTNPNGYSEMPGYYPPPESKKGLDNQIDQIKQDIDSMSEMGEMESLRLQMAMDRMSKMMSTLSNLLKKISDTASQITQNLK